MVLTCAMILERHVSPDGTLALVVERRDGDLDIGFEGYAWHVHGDMLAELAGTSRDEAVRRFVDDVLNGPRIVAIVRRGGTVADAWVSDDPAKDRLYAQSGEDLEFRRWDGTKFEA
jgi:hypothetical protein